MMNNISNKNLIIISLILHLLAAYFVTGWYHADEQSCILEYVNFKLGFSSNPCFLNFNHQFVKMCILSRCSCFNPRTKITHMIIMPFQPH